MLETFKGLNTNVQNKWTMGRYYLKGCIWIAIICGFTSIGMVNQLFGQNIYIEKGVRMLALGDSYTIGESVKMDQRWPNQFVSELRKQGADVDTPDYIATTGWTTSNLLEGIAASLDSDREYNLVSILIGVNNQYQGLDVSIYEPELRNIIDRALEITEQDKSKLFILSIPDYAYTPFGKGDTIISNEIDAYNEINRDVALEYGISWIDITPISRRGLDDPVLVAGDGLHPSGAQYGKWVKKIIHQME
jgi:lysophospholipase L1-like esterase